MTGGPEHASGSAALDTVLERLYSLRTFGVKPGVTRTRKLLDAIGVPDRECDFIHVAGTNGKGSTAVMISSILQAAGLRVGLFTSPHLVRFTERIRVNGVEIAAEEVVSLLDRVMPAATALAQGAHDEHPTFFEIVTTLAALYFAGHKCDTVVWEAGMGGLNDATNAVDSVASVIASVSLDHCQWLGDSIDKIAAEKAGIMRKGAPAFVQNQDAEVVDVLVKHAKSVGADIKVVAWPDPRLAGVKILPGPYQERNAALATAAGRWYLLKKSDRSGKSDVSDVFVRKGLENAQWQGRYQILFEDPKTILDCAHNPGAFKTLLQALEQDMPGRKVTLVFGAMADKDVAQCLKTIAPLCSEIVYVAPRNERALSFEDLVKIRGSLSINLPVAVCTDAAEAIRRIESLKGSGKVVLIAGSCYLAGDILAGIEGKRRDERGTDPLFPVA